MKIIAESHLDHGLSHEHCSLIQRCYKNEQCEDGVVVATFTVPAGMPELFSALRGPCVGDRPIGSEEVFYRIRGNREGSSRLCYWPPKVTREITAVMGRMTKPGPHHGEAVLFTAYPGPQAPREPWDTTMTERQKEESVAFWAKHALSGFSRLELEDLQNILANRAPSGDVSKLVEYGLVMRNDGAVGPEAREWRATAAGRAARGSIMVAHNGPMGMCHLDAAAVERGR